MSDTPVEEEYIGTAWMDQDGTITMRLRAEGPGVVGVGTLSYPKTHPQYDEILKHLGPMKPGDEAPVRPWPD